MNAKPEWCLSWADASAAGPSVVGGKGWNLARLARYGFRVPAGGVLSVAACQRFLDVHGLRLEDLAENPERLDALPLPDDLAQAIDAALEDWDIATTPLAVRSSAVAEDSENASFAGVLESFLNVRRREDLHRAIRRCWASAWSARANAYRERMGVAADAASPAVVLMALVLPRAETLAAGVAFSCDPRNGREDRFFIAANEGYGETVVGGHADPDEFVIEMGDHSPRPFVAERRLGRKECRSIPAENGGTMQVAVVPTSDRLILDDARLLRLARLVQRIKWALGHGEQHQDIEWVFDGVDFHVVQARPVTTRPRYTYPVLMAQPEIWTNGNFRDSLPMAQPALVWTLEAHPIRVILETTLRAAGYPLLPGVARTRLWRGRGYFNCNVMQWEFWEGFGTAPALTNHFLGGHQDAITVPARPSPRLRWRRLLRNLRLARALGHAHKRASAEFKRLYEWTESQRRRDWRTLPDRALTDSLLTAGVVDGERNLHLLQSTSAASWMLLIGLLKRWFGAQAEQIANALLINGAPITSAQHGLALAELAKAAVADPAATRFFTAEPFTPAAWRELPTESAFRCGFEAFLDEYGHRCVYELDLRNPRWREDPQWLLATIQPMVRNDEHRRILQHRNETAAAAWRQVCAKTPRPLHGLIRRLARQSAHEAEQREMAKSILVRQAEISRIVALEIGRRLTERGLLTTAEDVFHCTIEDLCELMEDVWDGVGLADLVADRKARLASLDAESAPDTLVESSPVRADVTVPSNDRTLTGLGVAAGVATGPTCLIADPRHAEHFAAGDVLVAPSTDPAWTPLFLRAAALVTETGGFISHGAIVAREYGIPAVVNVPGAMRRIAQGTRLTVNGNTGRVVPSA
ncbi:MAG: PEP/pyruvate-binding domain-containing protein [Candidatus Contendobacter sp.]|nr:PEP/pyruvate-binding domain-containing protein [Candidatus Contendobacter sp.]